MNTLAPYLKAALVADSLSLGSHWIYNQAKIARSYPNGIHSLTPPLAPYHKGKIAGDLTHYGDQTIWLQDSIAQNNQYSPEAWKSLWLERITSYSGYKDSASNDTLKQAALSPSNSNDLAGASRIAPILDLNLPLEETVLAARSQTLLTHGDLNVVDSSEFFVRTIFAVREGSDFTSAIEHAAQSGNYQTLTPADHIENAKNSSPTEHLEVATAMGLTCHFPEAFPLTLYYAIHHGDNFDGCLSKNALAGGDNSARAMLLALLFVARDQHVHQTINPLANQLNLITSSSTQAQPEQEIHTTPGSHSVEIPSPHGILAGVIEIPEGQIQSYAIFAHCFTCGKDYLPEKKITQGLAKNGIATLRIDFSGIGKSSGEFENSSFLTNIEDIITAADWLKTHYLAPSILVGHSLGGTAALAVASKIASVQAIATIGSPADPAHILHMLEEHLPEIEQNGTAQVPFAGRTFTVSRRFVDDVRSYDHVNTLKALKGHKLILHSTVDSVVELKNAGEIYTHLQHPKSFVALDGADHLLTNHNDAKFAADIIALWAQKNLK
ncbi:MAG: alpha/beta fold hydrolase [Akkermansiaceae bacterium]